MMNWKNEHEDSGSGVGMWGGPQTLRAQCYSKRLKVYIDWSM